MTNPQSRRAFRAPAQGQAPTDVRIANACEFIAHYLERIDSHLERLASVIENPGASEQFREQMAELTDALKQPKA